MTTQVRHLKIFISSTFQDMHKEREELLKKVFVKLKKEAKQRGVEVTEIDLRWGITETEANSGKTVKICLDEIERCQDSPIFFLGVLGNRYGWDRWLSSVDKTVLEDKKYAWIQDYPNVSITEIEILSALERNSHHNRAFFFVKEALDNEETKLKALKQRVQRLSEQSPSVEWSDYESSDGFRTKAEESLLGALERLYPKERTVSELEQQRASHQIFAQSREKIYIAHPDNELKLSQFIQSSRDRLLLYGDSGLGKSALVANFFKKFKTEHPDYFVIEHYIGGAGALSSDFYQMLKRVMAEIKERFGIDEPLPTEPQKIVDDFALWLNRVSEPTVIVLDGYNQLEEQMKEKLFYYLPKELGLVKLMITAIESEYDIVSKEKIEPLDREEKRKLVNRYLTLYGKTLDESLLEKIVKHPHTDNTLFLRTIIEEIRLIGSFERLTRQIEAYLQSQDTIELFGKIFSRFEEDYESNHPNLTQEIVALLYVSRDGLSENNLMAIAGVNRLEFSTLFLALEEHLVSRNGLYGFFHDYIREAVGQRYLYSDVLINGYRKRVADYFEGYENLKIEKTDVRRVRELPFQLFEMGDRERLYGVLLDVEFFVSIQEINEYELSTYFEFVSEEERYRLADTLTSKLLNGNYDSESINNVGYFFHFTYIDYEKALILFKKVLRIDKDDHEVIVGNYNNLGGLYASLGEYKRSYIVHKKALDLSLEFFGENHLDTALCYNSLAFVLESCEKFDEALAYYQKALVVTKEKLGENHSKTAIAYNNMGGIYSVFAEYDKALEFYQKALDITTKTLGRNHPENSTHFNNIAWIHYTMGKYELALSEYELSLQLSMNALGEKHPSTLQSYDNLATCYLAMGKYEDALEILEENLVDVKDVFGEVHYETAITLGNLAGTYYDMEKYEEGLLVAKQALQISEKVLGKYSDTTATKYNNLALFHSALKEYDKALELYKISLEIAIKVKGEEHPDTAISYNNIAGVYESIGEFDTALSFYQKALRIYKDVFGEQHPDTGMLYNNLGYLYESMGEFENALALYEKAYKIKGEFLGEEHPDMLGVAKNIRLVREKLTL